MIELMWMVSVVDVRISWPNKVNISYVISLMWVTEWMLYWVTVVALVVTIIMLCCLWGVCFYTLVIKAAIVTGLWVLCEVPALGKETVLKIETGCIHCEVLAEVQENVEHWAWVSVCVCICVHACTFGYVCMCAWAHVCAYTFKLMLQGLTLSLTLSLDHMFFYSSLQLLALSGNQDVHSLYVKLLLMSWHI